MKKPIFAHFLIQGAKQAQALSGSLVNNAGFKSEGVLPQMDVLRNIANIHTNLFQIDESIVESFSSNGINTS